MEKHSETTKNSFLVVNNMQQTVQKLASSKNVTIVLDNSGLEHFNDLLLADYLTSEFGINVTFECKQFPWFVSDVTIPDFKVLLGQLEQSNSFKLEALATKWSNYLDNSRSRQWTIRNDPFWTLPHSYWKLPDDEIISSPSLRKDSCDFIVFKGDLNYRKVVFDAKWPTTTPFKQAIGPLLHSGIAPFVMLRTCKADVCVGLADDQEHELTQRDPNWMVNGKFGVIQGCFD